MISVAIALALIAYGVSAIAYRWQRLTELSPIVENRPELSDGPPTIDGSAHTINQNRRRHAP